VAWYFIVLALKIWLESGPVAADLTVTIVHSYNLLRNDVKHVHSLTYKQCTIKRQQYPVLHLTYHVVKVSAKLILLYDFKINVSRIKLKKKFKTFSHYNRNFIFLLSLLLSSN